MDYLIYALFAYIFLCIVFLFLAKPKCKHENWTEEVISKEAHERPHIINARVVYRCTKCGHISFVNPVKDNTNER